MRGRALTAAFLCCLIFGAGTAVAGTISSTDQIGVNFIRFGDATGDRYERPFSIFRDFTGMRVNVARQLLSGDPIWENVEPADDAWDWSGTDEILDAMPQEGIVTLFRYQYADGTPPWTEHTYAGPVPKEFVKTLEAEAREYVEEVVGRYADDVKYWEVGNEMDHWRALDGGSSGGDTANDAANDPPSYAEGETFTPYEQGQFYAQVRDVIHAEDSDAVVLMPGTGGIDSYVVDTWLPEFVAGAGGAGEIDAVNYHYYGSYTRYSALRQDLTDKLSELGMSDTPVLNTETGSTSDSTLTARTDYPNSPESQSADLVRRVILSRSAGDSMTLWHTYLGGDSATSNWRYYGLKLEAGTPQPAYYTFKLVTNYLLPASSVIPVDVSSGRNIYKVTTSSGEERYVVWGTRGTWSPPTVMQQTGVYSSTGAFRWGRVRPSDSITLTETPVVLK